MTPTNKYGLTRNIDSETKRKIRQECGFGCISCGSAIYQYEHIDPEFKDAKSHDVDKIGLLCGSCHDNVTRGIWSKKTIQENRIDPYSKKVKSSKLKYLLDPNSVLTIHLGEVTISGTSSIILIDGNPILSVLPPEEYGAPPQIKAQFYDREGKKIAWIDHNEWNGSSDAFDIEAKGRTIIVRSDKYQIDLNLSINPPSDLEISKLNLFFNGKSIKGSKSEGFQISTSKSSTKIGQEKQSLDNPPFGFSVQGETIYLGSQDIVNFQHLDGTKSKLKGYYEIIGGELNLEYGESPYPKMQFKSEVEGGGFGIKFDLPIDNSRRRVLNFQRQGRNIPCLCGSQKKYKKCCIIHEKTLEEIINISEIHRICSDIEAKYPKQQIHYKLIYKQNWKASWVHISQSYPIVFVNTAKAFSKSDIGYSLLSWTMLQEGYKYPIDIYKDLRHNITCDLQDILLGVPVIDKMKLQGFEMSNHLQGEVNFIKETIERKVTGDPDKLVGGTSMLESIKILRLDYNVDFLKEHEKTKIIETFRKKSSIAIQIYDELKKLINTADLYSADGYNQTLLNCYSFFSFISDNKFNDIIQALID